MGHHHVEFALPLFYRKFLVADQENNRLALIFLIEKRGCELQLGGRAIVGERSFGGPAGRSLAAATAIATALWAVP
jgi:hypothetical protein